MLREFILLNLEMFRCESATEPLYGSLRSRMQLSQARIVEIREEIDRVLSQRGHSHKADSIPRLLQDKRLGVFECIVLML